MELIDKADLVEEIERKIKNIDYEGLSDRNIGQEQSLYHILSFINTLEVKEVDLNEEFNNYTKNILACDVQFEPFTHLYNCAKHFFELGINAKGG